METGFDDACAASVLTGPPLPSLKRLQLQHCRLLTTLPSLNNFVSLEKLSLLNCQSLTSLPSLDKLVLLKDSLTCGAPHSQLCPRWRSLCC